MVTSIGDIKELETKVTKALAEAPNNMLTLFRLSEKLEIHKAYLSGFLDGLVAAGKLQFVDIAGPVKMYALNAHAR